MHCNSGAILFGIEERSQRVINQERPQRHLGKSIGAVVGGIAVGVALTLITDAVLHAVSFFPPLGQWTPDWCDHHMEPGTGSALVSDCVDCHGSAHRVVGR
jgi:hypothetical protein